ncbi:hypothetical protein [Burkholderia gladioli]|uniref:hypothetical protein n=1 Tax=Burkholderia gladioli TaxID=28095 RepID=UPI0016421AB6|nr:hypothetical protein [Burkholderia gladioli]MDN7754739.1 hypothetical protein [Burkholderia gladioli]
MQKGTVVAVNLARGMFIVQIDHGDYAVFELLDDIEIAAGDRISGDLEALGGEQLQHLGQQRRFDAYGQSGPSSFDACKRLL